LTHHLRVAVPGIVAAIDQTLGQTLGVTPAVIKLTDRQQPRVAADRLGPALDNDRFLCEKTEAELIDRLFQHHAASVPFQLVVNNQVRTHEGRFFNSTVNNAG
jgi:hypothetical protein